MAAAADEEPAEEEAVAGRCAKAAAEPGRPLVVCGCQSRAFLTGKCASSLPAPAPSLADLASPSTVTGTRCAKFEAKPQLFHAGAVDSCK